MGDVTEVHSCKCYKIPIVCPYPKENLGLFREKYVVHLGV